MALVRPLSVALFQFPQLDEAGQFVTFCPWEFMRSAFQMKWLDIDSMCVSFLVLDVPK